MSTEKMCAPCVAAWGDIDTRCIDYDGHDDRIIALARALAGMVHETDEPTLEQVGWFMEDATEAADTVRRNATDGPPWTVAKLDAKGGWFRVEINVVVFFSDPTMEGTCALQSERRDLD